MQVAEDCSLLINAAQTLVAEAFPHNIIIIIIYPHPVSTTLPVMQFKVLLFSSLKSSQRLTAQWRLVFHNSHSWLRSLPETMN